MNKNIKKLKDWFIFWVGILLAFSFWTFAYQFDWYKNIEDVQKSQELSSETFNQLLANVRDLDDRVDSLVLWTKMIVPDYPNIDLENKIKVSWWTWTADKSWFIRVVQLGMNSTPLYIYINDALANGSHVSTHNRVDVFLAVSKWDVIQINSSWTSSDRLKDAKDTWWDFGLYYIPPRIIDMKE